jgi:hypothetical protein
MSYLYNAMIYNYRRFTGKFKQFPEVKGMSYRQYARAYLSGHHK